MKIVHVMRRFVPNEWGGSESTVFHLCQQLENRGIDSPIFCTDALSHPGEETFFGVVVRRFRYCFPWFFLGAEAKEKLARKGGNPLSFSLFYALLFEKDITVIHTHVQQRLGGIVRSVARLRGIPYVVTLHGGYLTLPVEQSERMLQPTRGKWEWGKLFGGLLGSRRTLQDAAAILCVGRDEYEAISAQYPNHKVYYVPNGVDTKFFKLPEVPSNVDNRVILCVSRIDYQKNQLLLVRAFAEFVKRHSDYRLVLIGPISVESYRDEIVAEAERLGVADQLTLIDGYNPQDPRLASAYNAADIFVLPSVNEPFGIVILEAWAAGVPVIASRVGGIPGFTKDGQDALLFESNNVEQLAALMTTVADDRALRQRLIDAGSQAVKAYDWSHVCDQVLSIYRQVAR